MPRAPQITLPPAKDGVPFYRRADVGLSLSHPFRLCTMLWDAPELRHVLSAGDRPGETRSRYVELAMPSGKGPRSIPLHRHEFYELVICRGGQATHLDGASSSPFRRGDVVLVIPGAQHGFEGMRATVKTNVYLDAAWFQQELWFHSVDPGFVRTVLARSLFAAEPGERIVALRLGEEDVQACEEEIGIMRAEVLDENPSMLAFNASFLKILSTIARACRAQGIYQGESLNPVVWRAARRIEQMIEAEEPFAVDALARGLGLSAPHLTRLFRHHATTSPAQHYQARRLHHACRLLQDEEASIAGIAARLHFADQSHFTRAFKKATGLTPNHFRASAAHRPADVPALPPMGRPA